MTVQLTAVQTVAVAALGVAAGLGLERRIRLLKRLSIPPAISGGLLLAIAVLTLNRQGIDVRPETGIRDVLMLAVFTVMGMNASIRLIARGGGAVLLLLALATAGAVVQNLAGMALAGLFGLNPLLGILAGAVSLAGGPATALAFGETFERAGVSGATAVALACATFGIAVSGLIAGTAGLYAIRRGRLSPAAEPTPAAEAGIEQPGSSLLAHALLIAAAMGAGTLVSLAIQRSGAVLPSYIGAMIAAAIVRNVDDRTGWFRISETRLGAIFGIALPLFIGIAMLSLRLQELAALAAPVLAILAVQTALMWAASVWIIFPAMRRDFDGAVIATGYCGFMIGITANALATMAELTRRFGPAPRAFLVVPVTGAFLIDFTNALAITAMMSFRP